MEKVYTSRISGQVLKKLHRPHDRVPLKDMKADWHSCLDNKVGFKGFGVPKEEQDKVVKFSFHAQAAELKHGSVVIAASTSCTNTSNPSVMLGAGLVAKKACELGLEVKPWKKTSLARFWSCHEIFATKWAAKVFEPEGLSYCWLWLHNMY